jgi:hypothetical protein
MQPVFDLKKKYMYVSGIRKPRKNDVRSMISPDRWTGSVPTLIDTSGVKLEFSETHTAADPSRMEVSTGSGPVYRRKTQEYLCVCRGIGANNLNLRCFGKCKLVLNVIMFFFFLETIQLVSSKP